MSPNSERIKTPKDYLIQTSPNQWNAIDLLQLYSSDKQNESISDTVNNLKKEVNEVGAIKKSFGTAAKRIINELETLLKIMSSKENSSPQQQNQTQQSVNNNGESSNVLNNFGEIGSVTNVVNRGNENNNKRKADEDRILIEKGNSIPKHKRVFGDVDDEQQFVHKRKQDTPVRPIDFIFSEETNSMPVPSPTPAEFRKAVYAYGVKALSKEFFMEDSFNLQQLINSFVPRTLGEQLDTMSAKLLMSIDLSNIIQVNALKLSLSRIVDSVNGKITSLFRQYLDDTFWKELSKVNITLCAGMPATSKNLYQAMMTEGSNNGKLNRKQLRVAVAKKKLSLLESNQTDSLQVLDIIDLLAKHCLSDSAILPNNTGSELTTYRKFAKILDEILDDTMLDMLDGESTCKASKSIAKTHEKIYDSNIPLNNGFGRRIDLILATKNLELSTSEWKRGKTSPAKCLQQQSKNIRMNKAILTYLLGLPFNEADSDRVFTVGMDWTGPMGYMFAIKQVKDIYVAKPISTLLMPSYLEELPSFEETLDCLYAWRNHHLSLKETMLPALRKCEQGMFFSSVLGTSVSADIDSSPNIYLTPSRRRRGQTPATTDLDLEDLSNDEQ